MPFSKGGRKHRRGGQSDEDYDNEMPSTTSTSSFSEEDQYDATTPSTQMTAGSRRRSRSGGKRRSRRGGSTSAATYALETAGNSNTQWGNVFSNPQTMSAPTGNGLWSTDLAQNVAGQRIDPNLGKLLQGGKRRHSRKGGNLMGVVGQAAVPFGLLALQQTYGKRKHRKGGRKTRRRRRARSILL